MNHEVAGMLLLVL